MLDRDADRADLDLLIDAARAAGQIAMRHFKADPKTWDKGDGQGPVTVADLEVNEMLAAQLRGARPDYGWMSEESEDDTARLGARRLFVIDPIDGTRAFIEGTSAFAHSLAVVEDGAVRAAAVFLPAQDRLYAAALGGGATLNDMPIGVSAARDLGAAKVLAVKPSFDPAYWPGGVPGVTRGYRPSLAYRLCLVAQGRFDGMITLRDAWEWDTAGGTLIASEAGATITDAQGAPIRYNAEGRRHPGCFAASPGIHEALLALRLGASVS